jgi:hypothetical protein
MTRNWNFMGSLFENNKRVLTDAVVNITSQDVSEPSGSAAVNNGIATIDLTIPKPIEGPAGVGISSVEQTTVSSENGGNNVVTVTLSDGTTSNITIKNGQSAIDSEFSETSTNAIQNKVITQTFKKLRTIYAGIEALGISTDSTITLLELFDLMDKSSEVSFYIDPSTLTKIYAEIIEGVKTTFPEVQYLCAIVNIRKNGEKIFITVEDEAEPNCKFESIYLNGVADDWVKHISTRDSVSRRMYNTPSNFGCLATNQELKLLDLINAMEAKSHVRFWITNGGTNPEKSQFLGIYNEILAGIQTNHPNVADVYGNVEIWKTDGTIRVLFNHYFEPNKKFEACYTTINNLGWSEWTQITTSKDVDSEFSTTSTNAIQNKVVKAALDELINELPDDIREYAYKATAASTTNLDELTTSGIWYVYNKTCTGKRSRSLF